MHHRADQTVVSPAAISGNHCMSDVHIVDVTASDDHIIQQVLVFRPWMTPGCPVTIALLEDCVCYHQVMAVA